MKTKLLILLALFSFQLMAQDARSILDKTSTTYNNEKGGLILTFTLNTEDNKQKITYSYDGKAYIKGNKFKIDVPEGITWFDGKTQWLYMKGGDEVNVSSPSGEELTAISPVALLNIYKQGFKLNYKGEKKDKGRTVYVVEMIPQKKGGEVSKFVLEIDKATNLFTSILIHGKDNVNNRLIIKNTQKGANLTDNLFVFSKKDYPNVEIIDLR